MCKIVPMRGAAVTVASRGIPIIEASDGSDELFIRDMDEWYNYPERDFGDNRHDITIFFRLENLSQTDRPYYRFVCRECGVPAYEHLDWFECRNAFVHTNLRCRAGCGAHWALEIDHDRFANA